MIYRLTCPCGAAFEVDERVVGKRFKCVACQRRLSVEQGNLQQVRVYRFVCKCGTAFRVEEKAIGGKFRCPRCQAAARIDREHLTVVEDDRVPKLSRTSLPVAFLSETPGAP